MLQLLLILRYIIKRNPRRQIVYYINEIGFLPSTSFKIQDILFNHGIK